MTCCAAMKRKLARSICGRSSTGPLPTIELLEDRIERAGNSVRLKVRLFNNEGGGIGNKLIWRVNGQTQGSTQPEALRGLAQCFRPGRR